MPPTKPAMTPEQFWLCASRVTLEEIELRRLNEYRNTMNQIGEMFERATECLAEAKLARHAIETRWPRQIPDVRQASLQFKPSSTPPHPANLWRSRKLKA